MGKKRVTPILIKSPPKTCSRCKYALSSMGDWVYEDECWNDNKKKYTLFRERPIERQSSVYI